MRCLDTANHQIFHSCGGCADNSHIDVALPSRVVQAISGVSQVLLLVAAVLFLLFTKVPTHRPSHARSRPPSALSNGPPSSAYYA